MKTIKKISVGDKVVAITTDGTRFSWKTQGKKAATTYSRGRDAKRGAVRALKNS